jgi:RND family efflux transporter MFP subunit
MAPVVIIKTPEVKDVENYCEFTGNAAAVQQVDIEARVEGYLTSIDYIDGADVDKGDLLFTIEPDSFHAAVQQAQAQVLSSQAELNRAQLDYARVEKAIQTNAVSKQDVSTKKAQLDQAQASVKAAEAALENAELNLSYTRIVSPISGRVSRRLVDVGNLVGAGENTLLATVVQTKPIYVYFNVSEGLLEQQFFFNLLSSGPANVRPPLYAGLIGQQGYPYKGTIDYIDNSVDSATGTIVVRGEIPNSENNLLPGMYMRIKVPVGVAKDAVVIDEQAIVSDIGGKYVLVVDANNIVQKRSVKLGTEIDGSVVIESGINSTERYIISGFHFARPGSPVTPMTKEQMEQTQGKADKDSRGR